MFFDFGLGTPAGRTWFNDLGPPAVAKQSLLDVFGNPGLGPKSAHSSSETSMFDFDLEVFPKSQITALRT